MQEIKIIKYKAYDGTTFDDEFSCLKYEFLNKKNSIKFFDNNLQELKVTDDNFLIFLLNHHTNISALKIQKI